jgi:hypothetical protein
VTITLHFYWHLPCLLADLSEAGYGGSALIAIEQQKLCESCTWLSGLIGTFLSSFFYLQKTEGSGC